MLLLLDSFIAARSALLDSCLVGGTRRQGGARGCTIAVGGRDHVIGVYFLGLPSSELFTALVFVGVNKASIVSYVVVGHTVTSQFGELLGRGSTGVTLYLS